MPMATRPARLSTLDAGVKRHAGAPAVERGQALLYRAELALRTGDMDRARASLTEARALPLNDGERASLTEDFTYVTTRLDQ